MAARPPNLNSPRPTTASLRSAVHPRPPRAARAVVVGVGYSPLAALVIFFPSATAFPRSLRSRYPPPVGRRVAATTAPAMPRFLDRRPSPPPFPPSYGLPRPFFGCSCPVFTLSVPFFPLLRPFRALRALIASRWSASNSHQRPRDASRLPRHAQERRSLRSRSPPPVGRRVTATTAAAVRCSSDPRLSLPPLLAFFRSYRFPLFHALEAFLKVSTFYVISAQSFYVLRKGCRAFRARVPRARRWRVCSGCQQAIPLRFRSGADSPSLFASRRPRPGLRPGP